MAEITLPTDIEFNDLIEALADGGYDIVNKELRIGDKIHKFDEVRFKPTQYSIDKFTQIEEALEEEEPFK